MKHYDWIEHHAKTRGDKIALVDVSFDRRLTYRELDERIGRIASYLRNAGVAPGERVATLASNCIEMLEVQFACFRIGAIFLPLNIRLTFPELEYIGSDAGISYVVYSLKKSNLARQLEVALKLKGRLRVVNEYEAAVAQSE